LEIKKKCKLSNLFKQQRNSSKKIKNKIGKLFLRMFVNRSSQKKKVYNVWQKVSNKPNNFIKKTNKDTNHLNNTINLLMIETGTGKIRISRILNTEINKCLAI